MLTFRQIASVLWTFLGFMVAAALVLNMRYKPLDEGNAMFLDTWTGKVHSKVVEVPRARTRDARVTILESRGVGVDAILLKELVEHKIEHSKHKKKCSSVRFAFPAPASRHR
jgi:hypothetical protein